MSKSEDQAEELATYVLVSDVQEMIIENEQEFIEFLKEEENE